MPVYSLPTLRAAEINERFSIDDLGSGASLCRGGILANGGVRKSGR